MNLADALSGERFNPYMLGGQALTQTAPVLANFKNPWASALATGLSSALGGALMGYGQKYNNELDAEGNQKYLNALAGVGLSVPQAVAAGMTDLDPEVRKLSSGLANALLQSDFSGKAKKQDQDFELQKIREQFGLQEGAKQADTKAQHDFEMQKQDREYQLKAGLEGAKNAGTNPAGAMDFISKQFDDAKNISSLAALMPGSTASNEFAGIQTNLRTKLQQMLGREMNTPEQEKLTVALPDWNDTKAQIDAKKARFMDLIKSVSKGGSGLGSALSGGNTASSIPPDAVPTGRTTLDGKPIYRVNGVEGVFE